MCVRNFGGHGVRVRERYTSPSANFYRLLHLVYVRLRSIETEHAWSIVSFPAPVRWPTGFTRRGTHLRLYPLRHPLRHPHALYTQRKRVPRWVNPVGHHTPVTSAKAPAPWSYTGPTRVLSLKTESFFTCRAMDTHTAKGC